MFKLSGVAILTAGLAGVGLFHAVWSWDTTALRAPSPGPASAGALAGLSSLIEANSGAWRGLPAPAAELPARESAPAEEPRPLPDATVGAPPALSPAAATLDAGSVATLQPLPGTTLSATTRPEPAAEAGATPPPRPAPPAASSRPAPRERMSLAGPKEQAPKAPERTGFTLSSVLPSLAPAAEEAPAEPPKFGPEFFTRANKIGGY
jgi:hypothetical protein